MSYVTLNYQAEQAISALDQWLASRDYTPVARAGIADHIRKFGCLTDCDSLDAEDHEPATEIFCESFPPVPPDSNEWDGRGRWVPTATIRAIPPEFDGDDYWEAFEKDGILPALCGGAPDDHYEPSEADLAEYAEWSASLDQPSRYSPESFARVAAISQRGNID